MNLVDGPKRVLITLAEETRSKEYPLCVRVVDKDGNMGQENLVRSIREGRIFGNGLCAGALLYGGDRNYPINAELDPRLEDVRS